MLILFVGLVENIWSSTLVKVRYIFVDTVYEQISDIRIINKTPKALLDFSRFVPTWYHYLRIFALKRKPEKIKFKAKRVAGTQRDNFVYSNRVRPTNFVYDSSDI